MFILCYFLGRFLQKTAIAESDLGKLSQGCVTRILDLRKRGIEPFFLLNGEGRKLRIRKRLRLFKDHAISLCEPENKICQAVPISDEEKAELMSALQKKPTVELPKMNYDPGTPESLGFAFVGETPRSDTLMAVVR